MVRLVIYVLLGISLCCQLATSQGRKKKEQHNPSYDRYNFFDTELFEILNRNNDEENILISPLSIKITLGMLMEGAEDNSAKEIRSALRLQSDEGLARKEFNKWMNSLREKTPSTILEIANRLFISHKNTIKPDYRHILEMDYLTDVTKVKFEEPKATAQLINAWISNQTSGLIPTLVDESQLSDKTKMLLTSAVYFKGKWSNPFPPERTAVKCFYKGDECKKTSMMMDSGTFKHAYISKLDAQAIDLPYQDEKFSMLVLLPRKRNGAKQLSRDLIHVTMEGILSELRQQEVYLQLPRFTADYHKDVVDTLKSLQISEVFGPKANFSRILQEQNESIFVSNIFHSAKIIVNEEGSEAAAATGALFVPLMGNTRTVFTAEHPFLFFIRDTTTGTILFAGKVSQPEEVIEDKVNVLQPANEAAAAMPAYQKPYENAQQIFYHEIFTPSPPINNAVQKEGQYVNRKPGRLPPPPRPTGLPNGFLPQSVGSNHSNLKDKDKSSSDPNINKPISTEPPSLFRPTTPKPNPSTVNPKRNVRNQQKFRYYSPIRRMLVPENLAYQEDVFQSYFKKIALHDRYHVEAEAEKSKKSIKIDDIYRNDSPFKNKYDANVDRISFLN